MDVKEDEISTITAQMHKGGNLEIALKRDTAEDALPIYLYIVFKNLEDGKIACRSIDTIPNVIRFISQSNDEVVKFASEYGLDAIAPGDYTATIYYQPNIYGNPAGQFAVAFTIKSGEVTKLTLNEEEMLPYKAPENSIY